MILGVLVIVAIGFTMWFQGNRESPAKEAETGQFVSSSVPVTAGTTTSTASTRTVPAVQPAPKKKPSPAKPQNTVEACIQAELDAGEEDLNAIFVKCIPGFNP